MKRRVRILHCLAAVTYGGVEQRRLVLARELDQDRYEQRIITREASGPLVLQIEDCGVRVIPVGGVHSRFPPVAAARALAHAAAWRPDVIHGAVFEGISMAVLLGCIPGVRVVIEETSHATNRSRRGHALFRAFAYASDVCVAVSPAVGEYLRDVTGVPATKIAVIPNGIYAPCLPPPARVPEIRRALGLGLDTFVVGTVGRMDDDTHKRYTDLIRAIQLISTRLPQARLLLVGSGREESLLRTFAHQIGVANRVIFTGATADVGAMYAAMDAFALVSDREAFGLVLVEAMFAGLPVITTAVGGMKNVVVADQTALVVPPRSPPAIAAAIRRLYADHDLRNALGSAGSARAQQHFTARRYAADVDRLYQTLLRDDAHHAFPAP